MEINLESEAFNVFLHLLLTNNIEILRQNIKLFILFDNTVHDTRVFNIGLAAISHRELEFSKDLLRTDNFPKYCMEFHFVLNTF